MSRFTNPVPQFFLDSGEIASYGRMYFYENKNFSTLKKTYSQPDNTVENTNPMTLTGSGRLMPCFGEGLYSVKLFSVDPENPGVDGALIWSRDDVSLSSGGDTAFSEWSPVQTYGAGAIVKDGEPYYKLYGAVTSKAEQPSLNPSKWEEIVFLTYYNPNKTYNEDDVVIYNGLIYRSEIDDNSSSPPSSDWQDLTFNQDIQDYVPVARGSTTPGTATYTIQFGSYTRAGRRIDGTAYLFWGGHTGTGNLDISLPVPAALTSGAPAGGGSVLDSASLAWTAGKQLTVLIASGFSVARIIGLESGFNGAQIPIDANGGITINFSYLVD